MKDKTDVAATMILGALMVPFIMLFAIPVTLWSGWAASILWGWFIVPVFGLPQLNVYQAAGVILTLMAFKPKGVQPKETAEFSTLLFAAIIGPPAAVGFGWIVKWMGS